MSYRCQHSGKVIGPGIRQFKVITERREKQYVNDTSTEFQRGNLITSTGWEIAKEITVGPEAYELLTGEKAGNITSKSLAVAPTATIKPREEQRPWRNRNARENNNRRQDNFRPQNNNKKKFDTKY